MLHVQSYRYVDIQDVTGGKLRALKGRFREAMAHHRAGSVDRAEVIYREMLREDPAHAGAWHLLGVVLHSRRELPSALEHIEKALSLCDFKAVYWNNYGAVLKDLDRHQNAKQAFEKAIAIRGEFPEAWSNLGLSQTELGDLEAAERSIRYALRLDPRHADALGHLAVVYREKGEFEEALRLCRDALAVAPAKAEVHAVEGGIFCLMKRFDEATDSYGRALSADPCLSGSHIGRGYLYSVADELKKAHDSYRRAAELQPDKPMWRLRHLSLCPAVFSSSEDITAYRTELNRQLDEALDDPPPLDWRRALQDGFMPSFHLAHHGVCNRQLKEKYARLFAPHFPKGRPQITRRGKIRVGFLCTLGHEGGYVRSYGDIMRQLDRSRFEVVGLVSKSILAYCRQRIPDDEIRWVGFTHDLPRAFDMIRHTACDIVAHRHADTDKMDYFLPFLPLAPIQVIGSGMHGTTGIANIDYGISSKLFERGDEAAEDYSETLVQFNGLHLWQRRPVISGTPVREDFGLPPTGAIYFCPQRLAKVLPEFDGVLQEILDRDTAGHVVVLEGEHPKITERLRGRLRRRMGEKLAERIVFQPRMPMHDYLRLLSLATVVLDTPNYSTAFTGYDALGLGIPVVTLPGPYMLQRYARGLYRHMGFLDLVASDEAEYIDLAIRLGRDSDFRREIQDKIRERNHVLFESESAIQEYETFFEHAVRTVR